MANSEYMLDYRSCLRILQQRIREPAPGRIQLLTGPRQVGKTTLLLELAGKLADRASYVAADSMEADLPGFWERIWSQAEDRARRSGMAIVLIDEVQYMGDWSSQLKAVWDRFKRREIGVQIVITGSSALRLGRDSRESLAGRFERLTLSHWTGMALVQELGVSSEEAPMLIARAGCYPGAQAFRFDRSRWRAYVKDAIIEPAIGRDILALGTVRRPALLRQVFTLCTGLPAQIISLQKLQGQLQNSGALATIAHYLALLEEAYLIASLEKYSRKSIRRRSSPPKIVVLNNALLAALDPAGEPDPMESPERFGRWVENACLAHAWNAGQKIYYWREEPLEVDAIIEGDWGRWAVEIKTGAFARNDLRGLLEFCRRNDGFRPLLLCGAGQDSSFVEEAGVLTLPWQTFLMEGIPEIHRSQ